LHELRHTFGTQAIRMFKIHEVQRTMGHRYITTTERYLHYAPDAEGAAKLTELWGDRGSRDRGAPERAGKGDLAPPRSPDAPIGGPFRGAGQVARPSFCPGKRPELGRVWGELALFGVFGEP
jgi:hypothetical protein